jgi:hypothetical protein
MCGSLIFSAVSADSRSAWNARVDSARSHFARSIRIAEPFLGSTGQMCLFGGMSEPLREAACMNSQASISSAADSPARTSAPLAKAQRSMASAQASGTSSPELLARYDRAASSWRTFQLCLDGALAEFSETWPRSGMTRSGTAYRLATLAPLTAGTGCGLLPMPSASSYGSNQGGAAGRVGPVRHSLQSMAKNGMWPTPTSNRWDGLQSHGVNVISGSLNPTWVEWLMGFPLGHTALESSRRDHRAGDH